MPTAIVVQARARSTRLPGKVLLPLPMGSQCTLVERVIERCSAANCASLVVLATSDSAADDPVAAAGKRAGAEAVRGSETDVLQRYHAAANIFDLQTIVRVTADCPFVDPDVIDDLVAAHRNHGADYTGNGLSHTFPHGMEVEVLSRAALEAAHAEATTAFEREHVSPFIHTTCRDRFVQQVLQAPAALRAPELRVTVDEPEDYTLACALWDHLPSGFRAADVIAAFQRHPWLRRINADRRRKLHALDPREQLDEAIALLALHELEHPRQLLLNAREKS